MTQPLQAHTNIIKHAKIIGEWTNIHITPKGKYLRLEGFTLISKKGSYERMLQSVLGYFFLHPSVVSVTRYDPENTFKNNANTIEIEVNLKMERG